MPVFGGTKGGGDNLENLSALCRLGALEASFLEIPALTCACVVATFFWLLLTLFIRKLRQVRGSKSIIQELCLTFLNHVLESRFNCQSTLFSSQIGTQELRLQSRIPVNHRGRGRGPDRRPV